MSNEVYELLALAARYWYVLLIAGVVLRAWRACVTDNRNAKALRDWSGEAGCIGELLAESDKKSRVSGKRFPIPPEGVLGRGRLCDVRIRSRELRRRHLWFRYMDGYLVIRPLGRAAFSAPRTPDGRFVLCDGDRLTVGNLTLTTVLYDAQELRQNAQEDQAADPDDEFWGQ